MSRLLLVISGLAVVTAAAIADGVEVASGDEGADKSLHELGPFAEPLALEDEDEGGATGSCLPAALSILEAAMRVDGCMLIVTFSHV